MAVQMLGIKTKFTDDQGRPLIGGSVHTYYAGTSLPQDTFSDPELTVPNTNPVKLDDTGSANIFLKGTYRVRVFDRKGTFVEEQDNVDQLATVAEVFKNKGGLNAANERIDALTSEINSVKEKTIIVESIADLSTIKNPKNGLRVYVKSYHAGLGKGGGYFTYNSSKVAINNKVTIINGWMRDLIDVVNIYQAGAKPDGSDCTDSIQAALDLHITVEVPEGEFTVSRELKLKDGQTLKGRGRQSVLFVQEGSNPSSVLSIAGASYPAEKLLLVAVKDLMVYSGTKSTGIGIDIKNSERISLDNVVVLGFDKAVRIDTAIQIYLKRCTLESSTHGIYTQWTSTNLLGSWVFLDECYIAGNLAGCTFIDTPSTTLSRCIIVGNEDYAVAAYTTTSKMSNTLNTFLLIDCCDIDSNKGAGVRAIDLTKVVVTGNWVSSGRELNQSGIHIENTTETIVTNNQVHWCGDSGIALESARDCTVTNNVSTSNKQTGILLANSTSCNISNNVCSTTSQGFNQQYGIREIGTSNSNIIANNNCHDNVINYEFVGKKTKWSGNKGLSDLRQGTTAQRPALDDVEIGTMYFDTSLFKIVWRVGGGWIDGNGTTV